MQFLFFPIVYYAILKCKYVLLEKVYLVCVLLKIMSYVNFYDNKWTLAFASDSFTTVTSRVCMCTDLTRYVT